MLQWLAAPGEDHTPKQSHPSRFGCRPHWEPSWGAGLGYRQPMLSLPCSPVMETPCGRLYWQGKPLRWMTASRYTPQINTSPTLVRFLLLRWIRQSSTTDASAPFVRRHGGVVRRQAHPPCEAGWRRWSNLHQVLQLSSTASLIPQALLAVISL